MPTTSLANESPILRLALWQTSETRTRYVTTFGPPTIRLAHVPGAQGDNNLLRGGRNGIEELPPESRPALLIALPMLKGVESLSARYVYRDWALDSGAFGTFYSGKKPVELEEYIRRARELLATDPTLAEVFSLDVIGDWRASERNTKAMWAAGVPAIPTFHFGTNDLSILKGLAADYPKVALGGMARVLGKQKRIFVERCFHAVWPKKLHGFGIGHRDYVLGFPFHSTDSTSWELGACGFGQWQAFGKLNWKGSSQNLRAEVEHYLRLEREARSRWRREMEVIA